MRWLIDFLVMKILLMFCLNSPCYIFDPDLSNVLSSTRQYQPDGKLSHPDDLKSFFKLISSSSQNIFEGVLKETSELISPIASSNNTLDSLLELVYRELPIGISAVSTASRFQADSLLDGYIDQSSCTSYIAESFFQSI